MKPVITFGVNVSESWKRKFIKDNYPDQYDEMFPEGVEKPSPKSDKKITKGGRKGGN